MNVLSLKHILAERILRSAVIFLGGMGVLAGSLSAAPSEIPLAQLIKNALERNGQIKEAEEDVAAAESQVDLAKSASMPKGNVTLLAAPIFEETGNAVSSQSNWSKWGPYLRGSFELVQPVYTFGMISSYRKAADNQVLAKSGLADVRRNDVILSTKEFYYSYLMANDLEHLVNDLVEFLEEAVKTADENIEKNTGTVKKHDVFRLKSALEDLRQKKLQATAGRQTAERAVSWVTATEFEALQAQELEKEPAEILKLDDYLKMAKAHRPEFKALAAGQQAREALRDAKRAQSYPVLFVGAFGALNWSPVREKQHSVFANDPFNQMQGGVGVGLRVDIDWSKHGAEAAEQNAELMKLKATEKYALPGIDLQVKKAFWELEQAREGLVIAERRKELSKKWFVGGAMGWSIGLTPAKDLLESLEGDGLAKKNYVETVFAYNMALARLSQAVGREVTQLKYRN